MVVGVPVVVGVVVVVDVFCVVGVVVVVGAQIVAVEVGVVESDKMSGAVLALVCASNTIHMLLKMSIKSIHEW